MVEDGAGDVPVAADIDEQSTLDFSRASSGDDLAFFDRLHHLLPSDDLFGLALAQQHQAVRIVAGTARSMGIDVEEGAV